jgi:hypothetical protein
MGIYNGNGLVGTYFITDISPDHEARFLFWGWGNLGLSGQRQQVKEYIDKTMETYRLRRVYAQTPDPKLVRYLKTLGFKDEGRFKFGFRWDGKLFTLYNLRKLLDA